MRAFSACLLVFLAVQLLPLAQAKSPILLINGILGADLEVKDDRKFLSIFPHKCYTGNSYTTLWVDPFRLPPCGVYELSMQINPSTGRIVNMPNVDIKVPDFGGTSSVEFLGKLIPYLNKMVEFFVDRGYERGKDIRAAPYDWRLAADELQIRGYYGNLKKLVETMYTDNGNSKVTMVVHSMGGLVSHHFLTGYSDVDQAWKDKYIHAWVPLSGAWSGGVEALAMAISGKTFDSIPFQSIVEIFTSALARFLVPIAQNIESLPWLLPRATVFGDRPLITVGNRDFTASDYQELFKDIGYENGFELHQRLINNFNVDYVAPNVNTYCYYGVGVPTPERFVYNQPLDGGIVQPSQTEMGDGDGTVNLLSSEVCRRWRSMSSKYEFRERQYEGVSHRSMVTDTSVLNDIALIVGASPPKSTLSRAEV